MRARPSQDFDLALRPLMARRAFPKASTLFRHGTVAAGIYLLETGAVRVLLPLSDNQSQLLEVAGVGSILGLSESLSSETYRVTAEADEATTASFIARRDLVELLDTHHDYCMQVVRLLSENLHELYHRFRSVSAHPGRPRRRTLNEKLN